MPSISSNTQPATTYTGGLQVTRFAAVAGVGFFAFAVFSTALLNFARVEPWRFWPWMLATSILLLIWLFLSFKFLARPPSYEDLRGFWARVARTMLLCSSLCTATSVWVFLPTATAEVQLIMLVLYMAHVPTQILLSPENTRANRAGIFLVFGSVIAFFIGRGDFASVVLVVFLAVFACVLYLSSDKVRRSLEQSLIMRLRSEQAERETRLALDQVAAERDAKTRFITSASHDLAQPLQAARLFFNQAMNASDPQHRLKASQHARDAFEASEYMIAHMLNYLRLEARATEAQIETVALGPLLARVALRFEPAANDAGLALRCANTRVSVRTDPALLERCLGNLIHNAIVHSRARKMLIGVRRQDAAAIRVWVHDNGAGIARQDQAGLFSDYFQARPVDASRPSGFGVGLASVRRATELLGGSSGFVAPPKSGASFYLELPCPRN